MEQQSLHEQEPEQNAAAAATGANHDRTAKPPVATPALPSHGPQVVEEAAGSGGIVAERQVQPEERELLLAQLQQQGKRHKTRYRVLMGVYFVFCGLFGVTAWLNVTGTTAGRAYLNLLFVLTYLFAIIGAKRAIKAWASTTARLAQFDDIRTVGVLAEGLELPDVQTGAAAVLTDLLPRLRATDGDLLDSHQRQCLHRAFRGKDRPLILAILKAYEQIGDGRDLAAVERLAGGEGLARRDTVIRNAAVECLPFLQMRVQQERDRQTLLRGATGADTPPAPLLRPAQAGSTADPGTLLHPSMAEKRGDGSGC